MDAVIPAPERIPVSRRAVAMSVPQGSGAWPAMPLLTMVVLLYVATTSWNVGWGLGGDVNDPGSEVSVGASDLLLGLIFAGLLPRAGWVARSVRTIPYRRIWLVFVGLVCTAYLLAAANQRNFGSVLGVGYQLYRYCGKWPLAYLLVVLLWRPLMANGALATAITAAADYAALIAIQQGYRGMRSPGPFTHPNELGAFLLVPLFLAGAFFLLEQRRGRRAFYFVSALLQMRALLFTESRGAWVAFACGSVIAALLLARNLHSRRMLRLACMGTIGALLIVPLVKPNFARTELFQRIFSLKTGTETATFEWRQERWRHFLPIVLANPLFGVGECEDRSMTDETARTPHNGYMAVSLVSGIPAMLIVVYFGVQAVRHALRRFARASDPVTRATMLAMVAGLFSLAVHNFVDSSLATTPVMRLFWVVVGASIGRG